MIIIKELDLYKFIQDTGTQISWCEKRELIIWLKPNDIRDFAEMVRYDYLSDSGIEYNLQERGYIAFNIVDLCDNLDVYPDRILEKVDS